MLIAFGIFIYLIITGIAYYFLKYESGFNEGDSFMYSLLGPIIAIFYFLLIPSWCVDKLVEYKRLKVANSYKENNNE